VSALEDGIEIGLNSIKRVSILGVVVLCQYLGSLLQVLGELINKDVVGLTHSLLRHVPGRWEPASDVEPDACFDNDNIWNLPGDSDVVGPLISLLDHIDLIG